MVGSSALLRIAALLYEKGFTVIGSQYKLPTLHPWKEPSRERLYTWAQLDLTTGRANSLTLRLDQDLAALDLDFKAPELTGAFVEFWQRRTGAASITTQGKKGGKVFFRLAGKDGPQSTRLLLRELYRPDLDFGSLEEQKADFKNDIELKRDVSAVCGLHSPGVLYGWIEGTKPITECDPSALPVFTEEEAEQLCKDFAEQVGLVPWGGKTISRTELRRAKTCINAVYDRWGLNAEDAETLCHFLRETGHLVEADALCVQCGLRRTGLSPYQYILKAALHGFKPGGRVAALRSLALIYPAEAAALQSEALMYTTGREIPRKELSGWSLISLYSFVSNMRPLWRRSNAGR